MKNIDEFHNNGQLRSRRTLNEFDKEHSYNDQPSYVEYDKMGNVTLSMWKCNGITHRCETLGPAIIHEDKGKQFWKIYMKMGATSRLPKNGPAIYLTNQSTKDYTETFVLDGVILETFTLDKDGVKIAEMRYDDKGKLNSSLHYHDGPNCSYMMFDPKKNMRVEKYHIHGVEFTREQIHCVFKLLNN